MTNLEKCSTPECNNLGVIYSFTNKRWLCKVCEAILKARGPMAPGFILKGSGWPGKEIKNGSN